ncbi:hypothetical protein [Paraburkholderia antibiotica]|uniref:Uncharacterized protein n=1 Tax=Paraburkholderia antibiotica TaxID=2728839 RepID=A0A7X9X6P1_9BURK|nr:hypothetical protein [Paraburkholderia antibiotica]NML32435.1 hypothetical protein [Paraburkholderia antibiotica]
MKATFRGNRVSDDRSERRRISGYFLLVATCGLHAASGIAGELDNGLLSPDLSGQSQVRQMNDPVLKDPYAALLEEQDPFYRSTRKALARFKAARQKSLRSDSGVIAATQGGSAGLLNGKDIRSIRNKAALNTAMPLTGDPDSMSQLGDMAAAGTAISTHKPDVRHNKKQNSLSKDDDDDDVAAPRNPAALSPCSPATCRVKRSSLSRPSALSDN